MDELEQSKDWYLITEQEARLEMQANTGVSSDCATTSPRFFSKFLDYCFVKLVLLKPFDLVKWSKAQKYKKESKIMQWDAHRSKQPFPSPSRHPPSEDEWVLEYLALLAM